VPVKPQQKDGRSLDFVVNSVACSNGLCFAKADDVKGASTCRIACRIAAKRLMLTGDAGADGQRRGFRP